MAKNEAQYSKVQYGEAPKRQKGGKDVAYIKIPDNAINDYLTTLHQIQRRYRFMERYMGKRIPVDENRKIMTLIKKFKALGGKAQVVNSHKII